jgi:hypothetical protein
MIHALVRSGVRRGSVKTLLVAGLVACMSLVVGTAKAGNLSTGINVTGNIDNLWTVSGPGVTDNRLETLSPGFPSPPWLADDANSRWLVPVQFGQGNAPPTTNPPIDYDYKTTFNLSSADLLVAKLSGQWLSDNNTVHIYLNGNAIAPGVNSASSSFTTWTSLTGDGTGFFNLGANTLEFIVTNTVQEINNPTGFRFDGNVTTAVPEPASLIMSAVSTLMLGGFSWKRRLARRAV